MSTSGEMVEATEDSRDIQGLEYRLLPNSLWRRSSASKPALRIGILLDSTHVRLWQAAVLTDIMRSNFAGIELLVFNTSVRAASMEREQRPGGWAQRLLLPQLRRQLFYDLYLRMDRRMKPANDPLSELPDFQFPSGVERVNVIPLCDGSMQEFPADVAQRLSAKNLDVLLKFGFARLRGAVLRTARYGVWSYRFSDGEQYRGGPPYFWELYEGSPLSGVALELLRDDEDGVPLCKALFTTQKTISVSGNRFAPYWGATDLVICKLQQLHQSGWETLEQRATPVLSYRGKRKIYETPKNSEMVRWLGPVFLQKALRRPFRKPVVQHWSIGIRSKGPRLFEDQPGNGDQFRWLRSPRGFFWADPFLFERQGTSWLFFEEYSYQEKRAWISCADVRADGSLGMPMKCLDSPPRHYSYPYVFTDGVEIFMIPEAYDSESVDLYRCEEFPQKWVYVANLLKGKFVDTSVWYDQGHWWMLTTSADPNPRTPCMLLFYADSLTGTWHFHPANPISTDVRNNRGAGHIFQSGGRWIRPSQSCAPIYGYSFAFNEITELSTTRYAETMLREVTPERWKGLCAVHTYNASGDMEVIDGARMLPLQEVC